MKPRQILLVAVGSRGDAEPFCLLAASLATAGASVELFLGKDLIHLAPSLDLVNCHALPFSMQDFYRFVGNPTNGADHPNPRVKFVGGVADTIGQLVLPCFDQVLSVAQTADGIFASSLARQLALLVADRLHLPLYLVQLQSLVPTRDFPHYSRTEECVRALIGDAICSSEENLESYIELERFQSDFLKDYMKPCIEEGSKVMDFEGFTVPMLTGVSSAKIFMVNAVSQQIIPNVSDAGTKVLNVGPLADAYIPNDFVPPADLQNFLASCSEPPVCVGFGSMPFEKVEMLLEAIKRTNKAAVLVGGAMKQQFNSQRIHCVPSIPYAWLLPQCSMMLCHGGAGVIHATLRAGIPPIVAPLIGDQFFFAKFITEKGIGVQATDSLNNLVGEDVVEAIRKAGACKKACEELGRAMRSGPSGATELANIILAV